MTSANRGFRDPVVPPKVALIGIATTLGVWLIVFGCGQGLRSCGAKNSPVQSDRNENDRRERPAAPPQPAPSRDLVRTITLKPNEWSESWWPGRNGGDAKWVTSNGKIEARFQFSDGSSKDYVLELGKWPDFSKESLFARNLHFDILFRHTNGGTVTVVSSP